MKIKAVQDITQDTITGLEKINEPALINLKSKLVNFSKWLRVFSIEYVDNLGVTKFWSFVSRKKVPLVLSNDNKPDAVIIIPIFKHKDGDKLVVTKEFRIPINSFEWGFPAGLIDGDESLETAAKRELKEETGLNLTKVLFVSKNSVSSAGLSDESVVYVIVECEGDLSKEGNESSEQIEAYLFDVKQVSDLITSEDKVSAKALAFLMMFKALGKIEWSN